MENRPCLIVSHRHFLPWMENTATSRTLKGRAVIGDKPDGRAR